MSLDLVPHVSSDVLELLPSFRVHVLAFTGARIGVGCRAVDELRTRVLTRLKPFIEHHRDLVRAPEIAAFRPLLGTPPGNAGRTLPVHGTAIRNVARGEPMMVHDDAQDVAGLVMLYYRVPAFVFDRALVHPPISAVLAGTAPFGDGALPALALSDRRGVLAGILTGVRRGAPTPRTRDLVLALLDPGVPSALDPDDVSRRIANWLSAVTGAELVAAEVAPAAAT